MQATAPPLPLPGLAGHSARRNGRARACPRQGAEARPRARARSREARGSCAFTGSGALGVHVVIPAVQADARPRVPGL